MTEPDPRQGEHGEEGRSGGRGGRGGVGGRGGDPSGTGGPGGMGGPGGDVAGVRRTAVWMAATMVAFVALVSATVWLVSRQTADLKAQQAALEEEQEIRAEAVCDTSAQGRATQLIFGEIIIAASADGEPDPGRPQRIDRFRRLLDERMLGHLPPACDGVMTLAEYQRRVRASVDEATEGLTEVGG